MRRFVFTPQEIDAHSSSAVDWHTFVRRREAELVFTEISQAKRKFRFALELGAGDGGQSVEIAKYCERLICTELDPNSHAWLGQTILGRRLPNVEYRICNAEDLSQFPDRTFDLIFSSNLLEHVQNVDACLAECHRALADDGLMLHAMPSRHWKVFKFVISILRFRNPPIHGIGETHRDEFRRFGRDVWEAAFRSHGFIVEDVVGFPFYFGHGPRFRWLLRLGNRRRWPGSYLYVLRKRVGGRNDAGN